MVSKVKITIEEDNKVYSYELDGSKDKGEDITMFYGRHMIIWRKGGKWYGKKEWCNQCGVCCIIKHPWWIYGFKLITKGDFTVPVCTKLVEGDNNTYLCTASNVPFTCLVSYSPTKEVPYKYCNVKFVELERNSE